MNSKVLEEISEYKHIGILRSSNLKTANTRLIEERIKCARRTALYDLAVRAGFHGLNTLNPKV